MLFFKHRLRSLKVLNTYMLGPHGRHSTDMLRETRVQVIRNIVTGGMNLYDECILHSWLQSHSNSRFIKVHHHRNIRLQSILCVFFDVSVEDEDLHDNSHLDSGLGIIFRGLHCFTLLRALHCIVSSGLPMQCFASLKCFTAIFYFHVCVTH